MIIHELANSRFGRLRVISRAANIGQKTAWLCQCDCGVQKAIMSWSLTKGLSTSCGCFHREIVSALGKKAKRHGMRHTTEYKIWSGMRDRCLNPNYHHYHNYGGRGITIDPRWDLFENFYADMGVRPVGMSLDRRDNNKGYSPENCRWATDQEQHRNMSSNRIMEAFGQQRLMCEWAEILKVKRQTLKSAIYRGENLEDFARRQGFGL